MKHILTCSFGKDSIATALLALQHGEPLDELVYSEVMFSDTVSGELPEHKRFIYETAIPYFEKRGIPTRVLRGQKTYLDCFYHIVSRGNAEGKLASFPLTGRCSIQRDCKLPPIRTYQKTLPPDTVYYLGIAADEPIRLARLKTNQISLLANYYLKHDFEKRYTDYGCPFMQADCDAIAPSDNLIIYGHNMKDGSMFADLAKYRSKDFRQAHKIVRFDTALGSSAYEIFAVIHTTVQADAADAFPFYRFVDAAAPEEFADYVSACKARALYDTGIFAEYGDKLLTLSTCDNITDDGRLLVIAKQTKTE